VQTKKDITLITKRRRGIRENQPDKEKKTRPIQNEKFYKGENRNHWKGGGGKGGRGGTQKQSVRVTSNLPKIRTGKKVQPKEGSQGESKKTNPRLIPPSTGP